MTTSEQQAELVQVGREFVRITRERDQEDQGDPYATPVANLVEAITEALEASEAEKEASEAARRDAWEAVDVARAEAERQEAEKARLIEAVRVELYRYEHRFVDPQDWRWTAKRLSEACDEAEAQ